MPKKRTRKRRERKSIPAGRAYIQSTFNNTIVTLTDPQGNVIAWGSVRVTMVLLNVDWI